MKKSLILFLTLLFLVVSFTASVNADVMSWTDRQRLDDRLESNPIGDEGGWVDTQSVMPNDKNDIIGPASKSEESSTIFSKYGLYPYIIIAVVSSWSDSVYERD